MKNNIYLGIFWLYGEQLIAKKQTYDLTSNSSELMLDSPFQHITEWETKHIYMPKHPELIATEYQSIPRGRIVFSTERNCFYVYMDNALFNQHCKNEIKTFFEINKKVIFKRDEHYQVF